MRVLISGSSGFVGSALAPVLQSGGHEVVRLVRRPARSDAAEVEWNPAAGEIDAAALEGVDAAVHLAGHSLFGLRWTARKKRLIRDSRARGTELLARTLARLSRRPSVLVVVTAIGYYGDRGDEVLTEDSGPGAGFLADVVAAWEAAARPAADAGIRVVLLRMAPIVGPNSPMLRPMLPLFRFGLGSWFGNGRQFWSWVALADVTGAISHVLGRTDLAGPVNLAAPQAISSRDFARTLGRVLRRPVLLPLVSPLARLMLGQVADEMLLAGQRVAPARLQASGYEFKYPELEPALRYAVGRS